MLNIQQINYETVGGGIVSVDDNVYLGAIEDINLTEGYVFVCGTGSLRVFDRSVRGVVGMGRERAVSAEDMDPHELPGMWRFTVATDDSGEVIQKPHVEGALVVEHETVLSMADERYERDGRFLASELLND